MAARTAANQLGYLLGAVVGGLVIAGTGYGGLGIVLAAGMVGSAWLILRVDQPARRAGRATTGSAAERAQLRFDPSRKLPHRGAA